MFGQRHGKSGARIDSLVGASTSVDGNVLFSGGLRIDGQVRGNVIGVSGSVTSLVIAEGARVEGEIRASQVIVNGVVVGSVHGADYIELQPKANVCGDVHYHTIEIQLGALVDGRLVHQDDAQNKIIALKPQFPVSE